MDDLYIFFGFFICFILIVIFCIFTQKDQTEKIRSFFKNQKKISESDLELLSTFDLIKELKKRENPPIFIGWIDKDDNNRINYFIFKKNLEKKTSLIILQKMIEDIRKYS